MDVLARKMSGEDRDAVLSMMREFYASDAVFTNGSEEIFEKDIECCISGSPYVDGYVFIKENETVGYSMIAKSYSTEFGKSCIWIEDIFIKKDYRGQGIGNLFFEYIEREHPDSIFRLEVEKENEIAVALYKKRGFDFLPYLEMKK